MGKRSSKMYKDKPTLGRSEGGKMEVQKKVKADEVDAGVEGAVRDGSIGSEGVPVFSRHALERQQTFGRHETEHAAIDYGKGGDKSEMVGRHAQEMAAIHKRHMKELKDGSMGKEEDAPKESKGDKSGEKKIEKVEEKKKEPSDKE